MPTSNWDLLLDELREAQHYRDNNFSRDDSYIGHAESSRSSMESTLDKALAAGEAVLDRVEEAEYLLDESRDRDRMLAKALVRRGTEIKALRREVNLLRQVVLGLAERLPGGAARHAGDGQVMAKAQAAAEAGRISWSDVARVDSAQRMGQPIPLDISARLAPKTMQKAIKVATAKVKAPVGNIDPDQAADLRRKANDAAEAGKLPWRSVALLDAQLRQGESPDPAILEALDNCDMPAAA